MNRDEDDPPIVVQEVSYPAFFLDLFTAASQCGFSFLIEWLPNLITLYVLAHTDRSVNMLMNGLGLNCWIWTWSDVGYLPWHLNDNWNSKCSLHNNH